MATQDEYINPPISWYKNQFAIIRMNNPDLIFKQRPKIVDDNTTADSFQEIEKGNVFCFPEDDHPELNFEQHWLMVDSARKIGYDPNVDGNFLMWLYEKVAEFLGNTTEEEIAASGILADFLFALSFQEELNIG